MGWRDWTGVGEGVALKAAPYVQVRPAKTFWDGSRRW